MRFYNTTHQHYCGIDLHAKTMYLCIINAQGETVLHRNMKTDPELLAKAIEPYREDLVISGKTGGRPGILQAVDEEFIHEVYIGQLAGIWRVNRAHGAPYGGVL